jgi:hypothetical protein
VLGAAWLGLATQRAAAQDAGVRPVSREAGPDAGLVADGPPTSDQDGEAPNTPRRPPRDALPPPPSAPPGEKRPLPDYSGRAPTPGTPGESFVWGPRVLLFPAYLVTEYGLRRPLVAAGNFAERHYLWQRVYHLLTWDDGRSAVYPIFDLQVALKSTAGAALVAHDLGAPGHDLHASAAFANQGVLNLRARDRVSLWPRRQGGVYAHVTWVRRPDGMYFGGSAVSRESDLRYYAYDDRAAEVGLDGRLGGMNRLSLELGLRDIHFGTDTRSGERPSVGARFGGLGQMPLPPGFGGYTLLRPRVRLVLDSRDPDFERPTGTGVRLEADGQYGRAIGAIADADGFSFLGWGAALAGFWDVSGVNHVLALEVVARFIEPISGADLPFTELASLGGPEQLRGFYAGRFRDRSAVAATLQYRYPIWAYVDGELFAGVGNAYPGHLRGLAAETLYLSYGGGLRSTFSREVSIVATVAAGTRRFDDPAFTALDATHLLLAAVHGF